MAELEGGLQCGVGVWPKFRREIEKEKFYNVPKFVTISIDHHILSIRY